MKIYTKTGDAGQTALFGGTRVDKHDARVEAYGSVDEANAAVGLARALGRCPDLGPWLEDIQSDLFAVGAELACPEEKLPKLSIPRIDASRIAQLEGLIDRIDPELPPLKNFVLPGGTQGAAALHQARTATRRAERRVTHLSQQSRVNPAIVVYLNRLSDLLFVLARYENSQAETPDVPWRPRGA